jgi:hypothetical protein
MRPPSHETEPRLLTAGVIAAELGVPLHRVLYLLATRPAIRPAARAGILRLYTRAAVELLAGELDRLGDRRCPRGPESTTGKSTGRTASPHASCARPAAATAPPASTGDTDDGPGRAVVRTPRRARRHWEGGQNVHG